MRAPRIRDRGRHPLQVPALRDFFAAEVPSPDVVADKDLCNRDDVSSTVMDLIEQGRLGMKTGAGLFDYTPEQIDQLRKQRAGAFVAVRKAIEASEAPAS